MKNFIRYYKIPIILIIILVVLVGIFVKYKIGTESSNYYISILYIEKGEETYELKVRSKDKVTIEVENGIEKTFTSFPRQGKERIALPDLSKIEATDTIEGRVQKSKMLWELTFMDSFRYIKYLTENGYTIEMYAATQQYVEIFLLKDSVYKRLIVFRDSLMMSDMVEGSTLPEFESYIENYRIK